MSGPARVPGVGQHRKGGAKVMRSTLAGVGCLVLLIEAIALPSGASGRSLAGDDRESAVVEEVTGVAATDRASPASWAALERAELCDGVAPSPFVDVAGNVHRTNIDCLYALGVTVGVSASEYAPRGNVTRAQMASFIANGLTRTETGISLPAAPHPVFTDVSGVHADNIHALAELGFVQGRSPTRFEPNAPITRAQMATIMAGVHTAATGESTTPSSDWFDDIAGSVHAHNIRIIRELGIAQGVTANEYRPGGHVRRDQMATFLTNLLSRIAQVDPEPDPDPKFEPSTIDATVATTIYDSTRFLYTGDDPVQVGVDADVIEPRRAAVLRGRVLDHDGRPLAGVEVRVLDHPGYGRTSTRADGWFDLAINGGGPVIVDYHRDGYLPSQRQVDVPQQDIKVLPDVALIGVDSEATVIDLSESDPQTHRASTVGDDDGERTSTVLVPSEVGQATMSLADGTSETLETITVRATEYTVGDMGPETMPGDLPPQVAYTYAVELSVDEAQAAGATRVDFDHPLVNYVDDFLGFGAGEHVPNAYYDREQGVWVPAEDGIVIEVLDVAAGMADIDVTGDGEADDAATLAEHGITDEERTELARAFTPGHVLWRVELDHFTAWDYNWPFQPPWDAVYPEFLDALFSAEDDGIDDDCEQDGSTVECLNQVLRTDRELAGTDQALHYTSRRGGGRQGRIEFPVTGTSLPESLKRVDAEIRVAGQLLTRSYDDPAPDMSDEVRWDGLDAYGRAVLGSQLITVRIGYVYDGVYGSNRDAVASFGAFPTDVTGSRTRQEVTFWQQWQGTVQPPTTPTAMGVGGWTLTDHHRYDPIGRTLFLGDGTQRSQAALSPTLSDAVGTGVAGSSGDGGPATEAQLSFPMAVVEAPDGSLYIAEQGSHRVRRVDPDGTISTFAGGRGAGFSGDGGPAAEAQLFHPRGVAVGSDGSLYIADRSNHRVRRVSPNGLIDTLAGDGQRDFGGDGGSATDAQLNSPRDVAVAPDGGVYIADTGNRRVRRVGPDGTISTAAGSGRAAFARDGGPATDAGLSVWGIAVGSDASVYIADRNNNRVRRVSPDGIINTVAGSGTRGYSGDGGPAIEADLNWPSSVAIGADSSIYLAEHHNSRVRRLSPSGTITTLAGTGEAGSGGDSGPATEAQLDEPYGVAVGAQGSIYIADRRNHRVREVRSALAGFDGLEHAIPSHDGIELYVFDPAGRHLQTLHTLTGGTLRQFEYDDGLLVGIRDGNGNVHDIARDGNGTPMAVTAPFGQQTTLSVDDHGFLAAVSDPAGNTHNYRYDSGGLLVGHNDARANERSYDYDANGRLVSATDAEGHTQTLTRQDLDDGFQVARTSAEGHETRYRITRFPNDQIEQRTTFPSGGENVASIDRGGRRALTWADGTSLETSEGPDPRFGMLSPTVAHLTLSTPEGLQLTVSADRTADLENKQDPLSITTLTQTTTVNDRIHVAEYDAATRTITESTPSGRRASTTLDQLGRTTRHTLAALDPTHLTYNDRGQLERVARGQGDEVRATALDYDSEGLVSAITDPEGRTHAFSYDAAGRVAATTRPDGKQVLMAYDRNANVTAITPPGRPAHTFTYTAHDLLSKYVAPELNGDSTISRTYNADRQIARLVTAGQQPVDFGRTTAGRLATLTASRGSLHFSFDQAERLISVAGPDGQLHYTYDGALRTGTEWSGIVAGSVRHTYDNDLRLRSLAVNDDDEKVLDYDTDGLLVAAGELVLRRDADHGALTSTELGRVADTYTYDTLGQLVSYNATFNDEVLFGATYVRDKLGRITELTETVQGDTVTLGFDYDVAGRLAQVRRDGEVAANYEYDLNGNPVRISGGGETVEATYDLQDRIRTYGDAVYIHDPSGHLASETINDQTTTYHYDDFGTLRSLNLPSGDSIEYLIDTNSRRIGKKLNGEFIQGLLYHDHLNPVAEIDGEGRVVSRFVYASRPHVPDYMFKGETTYRLVADHLGSVRLVVDGATGEVVQQIDYDHAGNVLHDSRPGLQPFGYAGGLRDPGSELVRFGARDYDPRTGRWTAKDPVLFDGGQSNLYAYVHNDPVNHTDPTGLRGREINETVEAYVKHFEARREAAPLFGQAVDAIAPGVLIPPTSWRALPKRLRDIAKMCTPLIRASDLGTEGRQAFLSELEGIEARSGQRSALDRWERSVREHYPDDLDAWERFFALSRR
jgi:RHS repeat-associated protein